MTLKDAKELFFELAKVNGLEDTTLKFNLDERELGSCLPKGNIINLSMQWVKNADDATVKDTILHEQAHQLEYKRHRTAGHGLRWKQICVEIGAKPQEFYRGPSLAQIAPKYELYNKETGTVYQKLRAYPTNGHLISKMAMKGLPHTLGKLAIRVVKTTMI